MLLSDHLALAPDVVAALKADLLEVISRYVDIDRDQSDISFEQHDRSVAMLASVPVLGIKPQAPKRARPPDEPFRHVPPTAHAQPVDAVTPIVAVPLASPIAIAESSPVEPAPAQDAVAEPSMGDVEPIAAGTSVPVADTTSLGESVVEAGVSTTDADAVPANSTKQLALGHPVVAAGRRKRKRNNAIAKAASAKPAAATPATG